MKLIKNNNLLIVVGAWNRAIFTEEWIKRYLLPRDHFSIQVSLALNPSHRIESEKLRIEFHNNRLVFIPLQNTLENYELISDLSVKISDYLPHTPVAAYGVNFVFEGSLDEIDPSPIKLNAFNEISEYGGKIINHQNKCRFKVDDIHINLTISIDNNKLLFDFNFHTEINNLVEFKENMDARPIKKLYGRARDILKNVYQIALNGDQSNV